MRDAKGYEGPCSLFVSPTGKSVFKFDCGTWESPHGFSSSFPNLIGDMLVSIFFFFPSVEIRAVYIIKVLYFLSSASE